MRQVATFSLVIGLAFACLPHDDTQGQVPDPDSQAEPPDHSSRLAEVAGADEQLQGVMILRVSERYLKELFARDINKSTPLTRVVLGTHARGVAHTKGRADIDTKRDNDDAAFTVRISGTTTARTTGRNGPAFIYSRSVTTWTAAKTIRFDGQNFTTTPTMISSDTRIQPLGAGSSLPGLRGRIVRRVAARRAVQCNSAAERIAGPDTERRVLANIDRVIEGQIAQLNKRVDSRPIIAFLLPRLKDAGFHFSTSSRCINVSFAGGEGSPPARVCPAHKLEPRDTELWFQPALIARPDGTIPELIENAGAWLAEQLPDLEIPGLDLMGKSGVLPLEIRMIDGWVVVRAQTATAGTAEDRQGGGQVSLRPM